MSVGKETFSKIFEDFSKLIVNVFCFIYKLETDYKNVILEILYFFVRSSLFSKKSTLLPLYGSS